MVNARYIPGVCFENSYHGRPCYLQVLSNQKPKKWDDDHQVILFRISIFTEPKLKLKVECSVITNYSNYSDYS